jgi:Zn-dependent metalloprotease
MKKNYVQLLCAIVILMSSVGYAQNQQKFIKFDSSQQKSISNAKQIIKQSFKLSSNNNLIKTKSESDQIGFTHEKYQQYYKGIKVEFATFNVHAKNSTIESMNGEFFDTSNIKVNPKLSEERGFQSALNYVGAQNYLWQDTKSAKKMDNYQKPKGVLVILSGKILHSKQAKLAYKYDIYATKPLSRANIYIDANTGDFLYRDNIIMHANVTGSADTRYSGTKSIKTDSFNGSYRLRDSSRGNGIETYDMNTGTNYSNAVDFTDNDNNWTAAEFDNTAKDNAALDAHYGAQMTYDYWQTKHNRNSYDGNGAAIKSYVHYDVAYDNAYWNGSVMTYGDGSGTYFDALTSLDVAAHEIGHAVMSNTANLTYSYESGALNEAFSDIWGASVEYFAAPSKQTWLIGEDIERRSGHAALRSMSDPKSEGQPDTYQGTNWATGSADNGGVHTNSGVLNYWFYLLSVGNSGTNDNGDAYSVTGISIDKAAKIAYRIESVYLTASSNYADTRTAGIQSAIDLYGAGSVEEIATTNAFYAVGVGAAYGDVNYCSSKGNSVNDEYIGKVQLNTINNSSTGNNGYTDFTSISTDLTLSNAYTITVTPTWTGTVYNEGYAVWIDYNGDGDFGDTGELVWSKAASKNTPVSGTFTIPSSATLGATRMRVSMKYNGIPTACEAFSYGEVEDYTINIVGSTADTQAPSVPTSLAASNITETTIDLSWTASTDNVGVTGYDVYKDGTLLGSVTGSSAQVTGLVAGTSYSFYVKAKDAAENISSASNIVNATTLPVASSGCTAQVSSYPYIESFENTLGLWSQDTNDDFEWTLKSGSTASSNTGPSSANDGSYYIYMESSSPNYSTKRAILNSPCYDFSGETQATLTFDYHMYGASTMGNLKLEASTDNGSTWTTIWSKAGNQGNAWLAASIDLASYLGGTVKFRFNGVTGTTWQGDMAIDNLKVSSGTTAACTATTLSITFDDYPAETSWDIKDNSGSIVFSGGTYDSQAKRSTITIPNCLDAGCYTFTMKDSYGDGMCCSYGNGSYTLTQDSNGTVLASGASFTSTDATNFCVGSASIVSFTGNLNPETEESLNPEVTIYPNPASNFVTVYLRDQKMENYLIINMMGQNISQGKISNTKIDISTLENGVYFIQFSSDKKRITKRFIKN